jgi:hypothetical protein
VKSVSISCTIDIRQFLASSGGAKAGFMPIFAAVQKYFLPALKRPVTVPIFFFEQDEAPLPTESRSTSWAFRLLAACELSLRQPEGRAAACIRRGGSPLATSGYGIIVPNVRHTAVRQSYLILSDTQTFPISVV